MKTKVKTYYVDFGRHDRRRTSLYRHGTLFSSIKIIYCRFFLVFLDPPESQSGQSFQYSQAASFSTYSCNYPETNSPSEGNFSLVFIVYFKLKRQSTEESRCACAF